MKIRLSARVLLTMGLVSLVSSAMLVVFFLGILPDRAALERKNRLTTAELLSASSMSSLASGNVEAIRQLLDFSLLRNPNLLSVRISQADGTTVIESGQRQDKWQTLDADQSIDTQIVVPLFSANERWGQAEILFRPLHGEGIFSYLFDDRLLSVATLSLLCSIGFYFYLGRMLRHLDPSKAVPDRVKGALDTLTESLLLVDSNGQIVLANKSFSDLVGQSTEKLLGSPANRFTWNNRQREAIANEELPWSQVLRDRKAMLNVPISIVDSTGRARSFLANSAPIMGDQESVNGVLVSLDDVTELEEKEVALLAATAHAEQANKAKSDFLANMSHEIRTPMNAVLGFTELMRRGQAQTAADTEKYLETIHRNGKHLLGLINDILDLSKVEAGEFEVESIAHPPHQVIHDVIDILGVRAKEKGIGLRFQALSDVPETIPTDPARLRQILTNLIGNAIKFTTEGEVVISERYENTASGPQLFIGVKDSGIGIPADKLATIFDPFTQAESSTTRRFGGTGLGLTISRKFAHAMGGEIQVSSDFGDGSEFMICLPVTVDQLARHATTMITAQSAMQHVQADSSGTIKTWHFERGRVLVVDDTPENRQLVNVVLTDAGIEVVEAEDGQQAVDAILGSHFDVVLMDMQMPVMDGYQATRTLRDQGVKTTIIAFTAHALTGFDAEIEAAGCDGYLTKPIDIDVLLTRLAKEIGAEQVEVVVSPSVQVSSDQATQTEPLLSRLASQPRLHKIIDSFVAHLPVRIAQMQTELLEERLDDLAASGHWLKGSAGSVGFDLFTEPSRNLEEAAKAHDLVASQLAMVEVLSLANRVQGPNKSGQINTDEKLVSEAAT